MENTRRLQLFGYDDATDTLRLKGGAHIDQLARVTAEHKGAYDIVLATGEYRATVTGKHMLHAASRDAYPAVGDWVIVSDSTKEHKIIQHILPRKTMLYKKYGGKDEAQLIATNVDVVFIVEAIDRDYNLNRFERYMVLAREGGVRPVIILNKSDLSSHHDLHQLVEQLHARFNNVDVLPTSTIKPEGLTLLQQYLQTGLTYCFLGSSGVGKSTIINKLLGSETIHTQTISLKSGRGRHTTTAREMYVTENGSIIIDNPGSREVGVVAARSGTKEVFRKIEDIARHCKFTDCSHKNEPGCAITEALRAGSIDTAQYQNYQKMQRETSHYALSAQEKRQKEKKFGKYINSAKNDLKRFNT
jgi:ribosome biogenesis GTPase / thiamine phosphate phosphatase